jgi:hypothetical protein
MEVIRKILKGAIDSHLHTSPDPYTQRSVDALTAAHQAKELGMRALVLKSHDYPTAPVAQTVEGVVEGIKVIGSLTLNHGVGGINPKAVEASARMGAKVIWMPTFYSVPDRKRRNLKGGIFILNEEGKILAQVREILALIKEYDLVVSTGHISKEEVFALTEEALAIGIRKLSITHPLTEIVGDPLSPAIQKELADRGVFIEHCFCATMPLYGHLDPRKIVEAIRYVGVERCILSTDFGQITNPSPADGMRIMVATMLTCGLSEQELEILVKRNPAILLNLE